MPTRGDTTIGGWPAGINNVAKDTALPEGALRDAVNVDLDNSGKPKRRVGRTKVVAGVRSHSLFCASCGLVFVEGADLTQISPDYSTAVLGSLGQDNRVSYDTVDDVTYLTNGYDVWKLSSDGQLEQNGILSPGGQPSVAFSSVSGSLQPGLYLLSVTNVSSGGEESGASLSLEINLSTTGTLQLSNIPQTAGTAYVRIYLTEPNGAVLREHALVPYGVTTYNISRNVQGRVLETQFLERMPPGKLLKYYRGRLWVADDTTVWHSEALRYGLYNPANNFFSFSEPVTVIEPVFDGLYIVADRTYFLAGEDPKQTQLIEVSETTGIFGTGVTVNAADFDDDLTGEAAYWYSKDGPVLGLPGGVVRSLTDNTLALPDYAEGTTLVREENGVRQAVTAVRGSGTGDSFRMGDEISFTVKRNGITL